MLLASESQFWVGKMVGMYLEQFPGDPTPSGPTVPIPSAETVPKNACHFTTAALNSSSAQRRGRSGATSASTTEAPHRPSSVENPTCQEAAKAWPRSVKARHEMLN